LCGAGYALLESLLLSSNGGTEWVSLAFARIGTGVIHILTAVDRLGAGLCLAEVAICALGGLPGVVFIHGLWNGLTVLMVVAGFSQALGQPVAPLLAQQASGHPMAWSHWRRLGWRR